jgi:hypothetical protein
MRGQQIRRRNRIFLACEGESEQAYGAFLQKLSDAAGKSVHLVARKIHPGGNPLRLAGRAVDALAKEQAKVPCVAQFMLMDTDMMAQMPAEALQAIALLDKNGFVVIGQDPDHEGLLLRHFADHVHRVLQPGQTLAALIAVWPTYRKNMPAAELQKKLAREDVLRAGGAVPTLMTLAQQIGLDRR